MQSTKLFDIIAAGALGDAFGYAIEFDSWSSIQQKHGPSGLASWPLDRSGGLAVSDDTQMTLFAMESIADALANFHGNPSRFINLLKSMGMRPWGISAKDLAEAGRPA